MTYPGKLVDNDDFVVNRNGILVGEDFFTKGLGLSTLFSTSSFTQANIRQIKKMNQSNSPIALYLFDGNTNNSSTGSGLNLSQSAGPILQYVPSLEPGKRAGYFDGSTVLSASNASLGIAGAFTALFVIYPLGTVYTSSIGTIISYTALGETQATNILYEFSLTNSNRLSYFGEYSTGVNINFNFTNSIFLQNNPVMLGMTRNTNGNHTMYVNGYSAGTISGAMPDGGSSSNLFVAGNHNWLNQFTGVIEGIKLFNYTLNDAQMYEEARQVFATDTFNPVTIVTTTNVENVITGSNRVVFTSTAAGNVTQSLFAPFSGANFIIKKTTTDANNIALKPFAAELIDGTSGIVVLSGSTLSNKPAYNIVSDGTNWWIL